METTGYEPFALHAPIQWAKKTVIKKKKKKKGPPPPEGRPSSTRRMLSSVDSIPASTHHEYDSFSWH